MSKAREAKIRSILLQIQRILAIIAMTSGIYSGDLTNAVNKLREDIYEV